MFRYVMLNIDSGGIIDLFPIEEHGTSYIIARIQDNEFLVAGNIK